MAARGRPRSPPPENPDRAQHPPTRELQPPAPRPSSPPGAARPALVARP